MAEITLGDLLVWERRLRAVTSAPGHHSLPVLPGLGVNSATAERELTWTVTVRATSPMLPPLRGGELVLLPKRALAESGMTLGPLLRELAAHNAAAVVMEAEAVTPGLRAAGASLPILVLSVGPIGNELEGDLNRLLTERRGELYRAGTDIGRLLAGLTTSGADLRQTLAATAEALDMPVTVSDATGVMLAAAQPRRQATEALRGGDQHTVRLAGGETLSIGPAVATHRALARLVGERVAVAVEATIARAAQVRPRGAARIAALEAFLTNGSGGRDDTAAPVTMFAFKPGGPYRVVLTSAGSVESALHSWQIPCAAVHPAGVIDGSTAAVLEVRSDESISSTAVVHPPGGAGAGRVATGDAHPPTREWIAFSSPVEGPTSLPGAAREARYIATLIAAELIIGPIARFESVADLGAYRLLFREWGSVEGRRFVESALGELSRRDRRGVLRATLLAYLETGGSHVESAARLGIHRNTLAYRLKQIAALTGTDPAMPSTRLSLHLALMIERMPPAPETAIDHQHRAA